MPVVAVALRAARVLPYLFPDLWRGKALRRHITPDARLAVGSSSRCDARFLPMHGPTAHSAAALASLHANYASGGCQADGPETGSPRAARPAYTSKGSCRRRWNTSLTRPGAGRNGAKTRDAPASSPREGGRNVEWTPPGTRRPLPGNSLVR